MTGNAIKWHWYIARANEVFIDADSTSRLFYAMRQVQLNWDRLNGREVFIYPSGTAKHYHLILQMHDGMDAWQRAVWELHCGSDRLRTEYIFERIRRGRAAGADFLLTSHPYDFRKSDRACGCEAKHKDKSVTDACPVMQSLLGEEASAEYFARQPNAQFQYGKVDLQKILRGEK